MEFWRFGCATNILVLTYSLYKIMYSKNEDIKKVFGCNHCYSLQLVISMYISIIIISIYCLTFNNAIVARGLFFLQIIYKLIMFFIFDAYAKNIVTITNLIMIPLLFISLHIGF